MNASTLTRLAELFPGVLQLDPPGPTDDLIERSVLDSLALIELIAAIEREFGIEIPLDDLDVERFRTLERIAALVSELTALNASDAA